MNLEDREDIMKHWDRWRKYIADGGKASWPRDAFESLLDGFQEKIEGRGSGPVHNQTIPDGDSGQELDYTTEFVINWLNKNDVGYHAGYLCIPENKTQELIDLMKNNT